MYTQSLNAADVERVELGFPGVTMQLLTGDGTGMFAMTTLVPGAKIPAHSHSAANEFVFVLLGDFVEDGKSYGAGQVFYGLAGSVHGPHSTVNGCVILTHYSAPIDFIPAT